MDQARDPRPGDRVVAQGSLGWSILPEIAGVLVVHQHSTADRLMAAESQRMTPEELRRETRSSIELTRNSKSEYQWVIKRYYENGEEIEALNEMHRIDELLRANYLAPPTVRLPE